jgi:hypothetical protein
LRAASADLEGPGHGLRLDPDAHPISLRERGDPLP